jgi:2-polyprenyl-3-methyl-5-hydroxy-6-metoxy-1,4-benzoquinol methylase
VIEHIDETHSFISSLKELLTPEGLIVGSVPNVRFSDNLFRILILKDWHYIENGILDKTHLRFFTKKSLVRLFSELNYKLKIIKGIGKPVISFHSGRQFIYSLGLKIIPYIFGSDSSYLQFAFLISPDSNNKDSK